MLSNLYLKYKVQHDYELQYLGCFEVKIYTPKSAYIHLIFSW